MLSGPVLDKALGDFARIASALERIADSLESRPEPETITLGTMTDPFEPVVIRRAAEALAANI